MGGKVGVGQSCSYPVSQEAEKGVGEGDQGQDTPFKHPPTATPTRPHFQWPMKLAASFIEPSLNSAASCGPTRRHFIILACGVGLGSEECFGTLKRQSTKEMV